MFDFYNGIELCHEKPISNVVYDFLRLDWITRPFGNDPTVSLTLSINLYYHSFIFNPVVSRLSILYDNQPGIERIHHRTRLIHRDFRL